MAKAEAALRQGKTEYALTAAHHVLDALRALERRRGRANDAVDPAEQYPWKEAAILERDVKTAERIYKCAGGGSGPMGLTPDNVRNTLEYREAKKDLEYTVERQKAFNKKWASTYAKIPFEERMRRRAKDSAPCCPVDLDAPPARHPLGDARAEDSASLFALLAAYLIGRYFAGRAARREKGSGSLYGNRY